MAEWPTEPTDIIREALREYVGDGDGADEAVLSAHDAEVKAEALEEAATSLEGGLGVEGTPGTLYEYRAWLRARTAAIRGER